MIKTLVKVKNDFYLVDNSEPNEYIYHRRKREILKVDGVGEISGEVFHSKGFSFKGECMNVLKTTNEKINIPKMDRHQIINLIKDKSNMWDAYLNDNDEIIELKNK